MTPTHRIQDTFTGSLNNGLARFRLSFCNAFAGLLSVHPELSYACHQSTLAGCTYEHDSFAGSMDSDIVKLECETRSVLLPICVLVFAKDARNRHQKFPTQHSLPPLPVPYTLKL